MNTVFSASNALCKWLKSDLPLLASDSNPQLGNKALTTNANTISWQCHVIFTDSWRQHATVIAVESNSLFTLLIPFDVVPSQDTLERLICENWANELVELLLKQKMVEHDQVAPIFNRFHQAVQTSEWVRNFDLTLNQHLGEVENYITQILAGRGLDALDDDLAIEFAWQINIQQKQLIDNSTHLQRFYSPDRFLEDGLARFVNSDDKQQAILAEPNKKVLLADFLERKKR